MAHVTLMLTSGKRSGDPRTPSTLTNHELDGFPVEWLMTFLMALDRHWL